jgi:hypothetical protein
MAVMATAEGGGYPLPHSNTTEELDLAHMYNYTTWNMYQ